MSTTFGDEDEIASILGLLGSKEDNDSLSPTNVPLVEKNLAGAVNDNDDEDTAQDELCQTRLDLLFMAKQDGSLHTTLPAAIALAAEPPDAVDYCNEDVFDDEYEAVIDSTVQVAKRAAQSVATDIQSTLHDAASHATACVFSQGRKVVEFWKDQVIGDTEHSKFAGFSRRSVIRGLATTAIGVLGFVPIFAVIILPGLFLWVFYWALATWLWNFVKFLIKKS
ncbi:hypothetical protein HDU82_005964 [Entophlyctis luteolus]|nr:hypothetical protein HDU82_005964 [Entophlyctis luteolus]KAJ3388705.1 hypothetical protein HDU84_009550 [Entophlyctis sp. JEL0112]